MRNFQLFLSWMSLYPGVNSRKVTSPLGTVISTNHSPNIQIDATWKLMSIWTFHVNCYKVLTLYQTTTFKVCPNWKHLQTKDYIYINSTFKSVFHRREYIVGNGENASSFDTTEEKKPLKTLWEKQKMLITSIFSFFYSVFNPVRDKNNNF